MITAKTKKELIEKIAKEKYPELELNYAIQIIEKA